MNVWLDLFTELVYHRLFVQQRVLDDVAFRVRHQDIAVMDFDVLARFLPILYAFKEVVAVFFAEMQVAVFILHDVVHRVAAVLVLKVV